MSAGAAADLARVRFARSSTATTGDAVRGTELVAVPRVPIPPHDRTGSMDYPYVIVDGSNIATEARSLPSLQQLDEAVRAFLEQNEVGQLTVIVDATFGHRIDASEKEEFDAAIANAEIITPPAGTIGRGDAFVLQVAERAGATILSNDSFQEFHGEYEWLFDEGRLIGGKPVPGIGWVFTSRTPVRGPISRRATREAKGGGGGRKRSSSGGGRGDRGGRDDETSSSKASKSRSRSRSKAKGDDAKAPAKRSSSKAAADAGSSGRGGSGSGSGSGKKRRRSKPSSSEPLNELLPFLDFLGTNPPGTQVDATVDSYASHGAYVKVEDLLGYVPLKAMGDPAPQKARDVLRVGDVHRFEVTDVDTPRRGLDLALVLDDAGQPLPPVSVAADGEPATGSTEPRRRSRRSATRGAGEAKDTTRVDGAVTTTGAESTEEAPVSPAKKAAKKRTTKKAAAKKATKKAPAKRTTKKAAAKKATKKAPAKRTTKKAAAKKATKKAPAKRTTKKAAAKKATKKAPAKKSSARRR